MNIEDKLQLLDIHEVTTARQKANGTREFKLPVRDQYGCAIHVASYATGYVRRTKTGGYSSDWQLNKTRKYQTKWDKKRGTYSIERILIPKESHRLEYLIAFCLKNYYIKQSNMLSSGEFIPKWKHEDKIAYVKERYDVDKYLPEVKVIINGHRYNVT